jgi:hypothetical protein
MIRRLNRVGTGTLTISLPRAWVKSHDLGKGDEINIVEKDDDLLLTLETKESKTTATLNIDDGDWLDIRRTIGGVYRAGISEINIRATTPDLLLEVQKAVTGSLGYEFFQETPTKAKIRSIVGSFDIDLDGILQKMSHIVNSIHEMTIKAIESREFKEHAHIEALRHNLLNYRNLVCRTIYTNRMFDVGTFPKQDIAVVISSIGGEYLLLYQWLKDNQSKHSEAEILILKETNNLFREIYTQKKAEPRLNKKARSLNDRILNMLGVSGANKQTLAACHAIERLAQSILTHYSTMSASTLQTKKVTS